MTAAVGTTRRAMFPAMGTTVTVLFDGDVPTGALGEVRELFERWEATLSRFRPDSELSRLNREAGREMPASPLLRRVTSAALRAAAATGGVFDPTLGRRLAAIGYGAPFGSPQAVARGSATGVHVADAWRGVRVDEAAGTIRIPTGVALDFGGIAKGMAVDDASDRLASAGIAALVNAGGDLRTTGVGGATWQISLDEAPGEQVTLASGSVATSSVSRRAWTRRGRRYHHLIDPATGAPAASGVRAVSVAATKCAHAEVAAKTALILGREHGVRFVERLGIAALFTLGNGTVVRAGAWPEGV